MAEKKILILVMSCTLPYYRDKERSIRETWAKPILEGGEPNVDLWFFNSGTCDCHDLSTHRIFVNTDDRRDRTFQKVCKTLMYVNSNKDVFDYDYILRVNISTVINVPLLKELVQHITDEEDIWTCTTYNQNWVASGAPFFSGECYLLSRANVGTVLDFYIPHKAEFDDLESDQQQSNLACDDGWMTVLFSKKYGDKYPQRLKTFGIVYEPLDELLHKDMYSSHIAVTHKTDYLNASENRKNIQIGNLDNHPIYEILDRRKREAVWKHINQNKFEGDWWEYFCENILDKECRSSQNRDDDAYCPKQQIIDNWKKN